jgi:hypothetical protein
LDIAGAKALKDRLGAKGAEGSPSPADVDVPVPEDAPPVYHWFGVGAERPVADDEPTPNASLFRRLGLSFR